MTSSKSRTLRKAGAVALSLALAMSTFAGTGSISLAKKGVSIAKSTTVKVKQTKKLKIKGVKKSKVKSIKVTSKKTSIATAKKSGKVAIKVTGKKKGSTKVITNLKLKKKVGGKKKYKLTTKVTVKAAEPAPTEAPAPTVAPTTGPAATATPVVPGQGIKMLQTTATVTTGFAVTLTAELTPSTSNDTVTWSSQNTAFATVAAAQSASGVAADVAKASTGSSAAAAVNGKAYATVYGVAEGSTIITAKVGNYTATCNVTVSKNIITAKLLDVKETKTDTVELTFDIDTRTSTTPITKDQIEISELDANKKAVNTKTVNKLTPSADGKILTAQISGHFDDQKVYSFTYNKVTIEKTMLDGKVTGGSILTASAEVNTDTPIEFILLDANGIDVTPSHVLDQEVAVESTGSGVLTATRASKASIKFENVGDKAEITITHTDKTVTPEKATTFKGTITCVKATAKVGKGRFKDATDGLKNWGDSSTEKKNQSAKFYKGTDATVINVESGSEKLIWFCADKDGSIIKYDSYEVTTANDMRATVEEVTSHGRFVAINVKGQSQTGSVNLNVKATSNGVATPYVIPVNVRAAAAPKKAEIKASRTKLTNAQDIDYYSKVEVTVYDQYGNKLTAGTDYSVDWNIDKRPDLSKDNPSTAMVLSPTAMTTWSTTGLNDKVINDSTGAVYVYAPFAKASSSYAIKATITCTDGTKFTPAQTLQVVDAFKMDTTKEGNANQVTTGFAFKYELEASASTVDISKCGTTGYANPTVRLAALDGTNFIGYVRYDGAGTYSIGSYDGIAKSVEPLAAKNAIQNIDVDVNFAGKVVDNNASKATGWTTPTDTVVLYGASGIDARTKHTATTCGAFVTLDVADEDQFGKGVDLVQNKADYDPVYAQADKTATVKFTVNTKDGKTATGSPFSKSIKITNGFTFPKVTFSSDRVGDLNENGVKEVTTVDVDMNSETDLNASVDACFIKSFDYDKDKKVWSATDTTAGSSEVAVNYVTVKEDGKIFAVAVNNYRFTLA